MTDTLVLNPVFGFEELREDELAMVDGGVNINWNAVSQALAQAQMWAIAHSAQLYVGGVNAINYVVPSVICGANAGQTMACMVAGFAVGYITYR
jgi:hypothetical protein